MPERKYSSGRVSSDRCLTGIVVCMCALCCFTLNASCGCVVCVYLDVHISIFSFCFKALNSHFVEIQHKPDDDISRHTVSNSENHGTQQNHIRSKISLSMEETVLKVLNRFANISKWNMLSLLT